MLKQVMDLLGGRVAPSRSNGAGDVQLAVAALLVEAARMDSDFDAAERATIRRLLAARFELSPEATEQLIASAEHAVQNATQLFPFTREVCKRMDPEARALVVEMLWKVAYSDGTLDPHEDMLVRRVAGLIHVPDRQRATARQEALAKLAARRDPPSATD